jgi:hypothetical protein
MELEAAEAVAYEQRDLIKIKGDEVRVELLEQRRAVQELECQLETSRAECQLYISEMEVRNVVLLCVLIRVCTS